MTTKPQKPTIRIAHLLWGLCVIALLCTLFAVQSTAASTVASGNCGDNGSNVKWIFDSDGVLTISGSGKMADYHSTTNVPWHNFRSSVLKIVIKKGVTRIGQWVFYSCDFLKKVTIPYRGYKHRIWGV